ncbi:PREDICTED: filamin-C-like, partial [Amphimedon queenslandica]
MSNKYNLNFIGKSIGEASVIIKWGEYQISKTPFTISVCDAEACTVDASEMTKNPLQVGVPFTFKVHSTGAGKADLSIKPGDTSDSRYTIITTSDNDVHTVACTPWTVGEQSLSVTRGGEHVKGSPLSFSVCDPRQCKITDLPDADHCVPLLGVPIEFSIDYHLAGPGEVSFVVRLPDGSEEEQEGEEGEEGVVVYSYAPEELGSLEFLLEFNGISLLRNKWICEVPDPSIFRAIAPKGMCRLDEPVQFYVTGITKQTEDFIVTGTDPNSVEIEATKEQHIHNSSISVVQFTATVVGEYSIQVKHDSSDIDGSPFIICVTNPAGARITGSIPDNPKVGEKLSLSIDASKCGPGDISCDLIPLYGEIDIEPQILSSPDEDELYEISFSSQVVLNCFLELRLAGYLLQPSPQYLSFVDPSKVLVNSKELESGDMINQGDPLSIEIDGREGGCGTPEAKVSMGGAPVDVDLVDNRDGTFLARVIALEAADY